MGFGIFMKDKTEKPKKTLRRKILLLERDLHHFFQQEYVERLPGQLNQHEGRVLSFLVNNPGSSAKEVIDEFRLKKPTVSGILKSLAAKGYIAFATAEIDARKKDILLLPSAQEREKQVSLIFGEFDAIVERGISQEEIAAFDRIAKKIEDNIKGAMGK